jgi:hypothetical protein
VRVFAGLQCTVVGERPPAPGFPAARGGDTQPADFLVFFFHGYQVLPCRDFDLVGGALRAASPDQKGFSGSYFI